MLNYIKKMLFEKKHQQACFPANKIIKYKLNMGKLFFFERRSFANRIHNLELKTNEMRELTKILRKESLITSDLLNFTTAKEIEILLETININLTKLLEDLENTKKIQIFC